VEEFGVLALALFVLGEPGPFVEAGLTRGLLFIGAKEVNPAGHRFVEGHEFGDRVVRQDHIRLGHEDVREGRVLEHLTDEAVFRVMGVLSVCDTGTTNFSTVLDSEVSCGEADEPKPR
jgi:hypothetical protein